MSRRVIRKSSRYCEMQVADLLQSLLAVELISPSSVLWLVSAWVSDVPILDNTAGEFVGIDPNWGARPIHLSEVLVLLASRDCEVVIASNQDPHNRLFLERLKAKAQEAGVSDAVHTSQHEDLHVKGLLGDDYHVHGSMNFTHNGIHVLAEEVILELAPDHVQRARIEFREWFGPRTGV